MASSLARWSGTAASPPRSSCAISRRGSRRLNSLQVFTFVDWGRIDDIGNPTLNPKGFEELASGGFGVRFQLFDTLYGDFYYAHPVTRALSTAERRPKGGVKFTLTKYF